MQLNNDSKQKYEILIVKDYQRTSTNLKRSGSSRKIALIKTQISKQIVTLIIIQIRIDLIENGKRALNENERNCQIMGSQIKSRLIKDQNIRKLK